MANLNEPKPRTVCTLYMLPFVIFILTVLFFALQFSACLHEPSPPAFWCWRSQGLASVERQFGVDFTSTKSNRKLLQFFVANIPVTNHGAMGTLFSRKIAKRIGLSSKNRKKNPNRLRFSVARNHRKAL